MSLDSNKTYIGATNNPEKRIATHNRSKGAKYTKGESWVPILIVSGFESKRSCLSFENVWKKVSKRRTQARLLHLNLMTGLNLFYSKDPKHDRIIDLVFLLNGIMVNENKWKCNGSVPEYIGITVMMEDWIKDLPWPFYVDIR